MLQHRGRSPDSRATRAKRSIASLSLASALVTSAMLGGCAVEVEGAPAAKDEVGVVGQALHINYGSWNPNRPTTSALAIHAALVPTSTWRSSSSSRVLYFGGSQHDPQLPWGRNSWRLFDPSTSAISTLSFGGADMFCSGHAHMKDGKLLIMGGTEFYAGYREPPYLGHIPSNLPPTANCVVPDGSVKNINMHKCSGHFSGHRTTYAFDFSTNTFSQLGSTASGRWYPTIVRTKGNGGFQLAAIGGHRGASEAPVGNGGHDNWDYEAINTTNWVNLNPDSVAGTDHYPRAHLVPSNGGLLVMNSFVGAQTVTLAEGPDGSLVGVPVAVPPVDYRGFDTSSVLLPLRPNAQGVYPAGRIVVTGAPQYYMLDMANTGAGWQNMPRPNPADGGGIRRRMHSYSTILSTGDLFVSGGYVDGRNEATAVRYTEIYREDLNAWQEGPAAVVGRNYHSTTLLLPDGRVWTAGGNKRAGFSQTEQLNGDGRELRIEIFEPWYYSLSRPAIASGTALVQPPSSGAWRINTATGTTGTSITRVALIAPGSSTHAFNVDQRYVELRVTGRGSNFVDVSVPSSPAVLPRGMYLLVISRSSNGNAAGAHVPSVGRWVRVP
jgi:hypothetical protein